MHLYYHKIIVLYIYMIHNINRFFIIFDETFLLSIPSVFVIDFSVTFPIFYLDIVIFPLILNNLVIYKITIIITLIFPPFYCNSIPSIALVFIFVMKDKIFLLYLLIGYPQVF